jgi:hydroxyacylglutathione hydrolase
LERDAVEISRITASETNCYLLQGKGLAALIDAGPTSGAATIITGLQERGVHPGELGLILITHGHLDHYGAVPRLREWSAAPVAAHHAAPSFSQDKANALPPAQTLRGSLVRLLYLALAPVLPIQPLAADVLFSEGDSLEEYGLHGQLLSVPGHSPESLALITPDGDAFVGDLLVNYGVPSRPIYLSDHDAWEKSYRRIRDLRPRMVYPGHGEPFAGDQLDHVYPARYQWRWWVR